MVPLIFLALFALAQGADIIGLPSPDWPAERWVQGGPLRLADLRGRVVLIRFFMDARCPLCRGTAPALNELYREFAPKGMVVIGFYTPKPRPRPTTVEEVRDYVKAFGFRFPIAVDDDWGCLRRLWLDRVPEAEFTSASLLIDRKGIVRHIQAGGTYSKDSKDRRARSDYESMRSAIIKLLAEQ